MPSFVERLHSSSVLGNPFSPSTRQDDPMGMLDQFIKRLPRKSPYESQNSGGNLRRVGQRISGQPEEPMNVVYQPSISEQIGQKRIADIVHPDPELAMKEKLAQAQMGMKQADLGIKQQRANVYQFKAQNPTHKFIQGKDGILRAVDPMTNEVTELGSTGMSDEEIANLNQENKMTQIEATGKNRLEAVHATGEEARKTKAVPPGKAPTEPKPLQPTQQKTAMQIKMNKILNEHPEWRDYVNINDQGFPVVTMPDTHWGPGNNPEDKTTYDTIYNSIYGEETPAKTATPPPTTTTTTPSTTKETGTVRVKAPNGQTGTWDLSKGPVPSGYTKIGK